MNKGLAFAFFISCCVTAFSLAILTYTFYTGDLPYGMQPLMKPPEKPVKKPSKQLFGVPDGSKNRILENDVKLLYAQLTREREKLAREREKLAHKRKLLDENEKQAEKFQGEIKGMETKLEALLDNIDKQELANLTNLSGIISGMDVAEGSKLLMQFDDKMACRLLKAMNRKSVSKIIQQIMKSNDPEQVRRIKKITDDMYKLTENKAL